MRPVLLSLCLLPVLASGAEFKNYLSVEGRAGNSQLQQANSVTRSDVSGQIVALPAVKLGADDTLTFLGLLSSSNTDRIIAEDGFFVGRNTALFKPSWRHAFGEKFKAQLRASAMHGAMLESPGQNWFSNPYDFEEYGAGAGLSYDSALFGGPWQLGLGADLLHRGYPNYRELTGGFTAGKNLATKDYDGVKVLLESRHRPSSAWGGRLAANALLKAFPDAYVAASDGTLTGEKGTENTLTFNLDVDRAAYRGGRATLGLEAQVNSSNRSFFDLGQRKFMADYYGYSCYSVSPSYVQPLYGEKSGHQISLGYDLTQRSFNGRLARDAAGAYTSQLQVDLEQSLFLDLRFALANGWSAVGGGSLRNISSNNAYEFRAANSYTLLNLNLGLEFKL
jgi:hypothetical protein